MKKAKTQIEAILNLLKEGKPVNIMSCFKATGSMKLSTRICDLQKKGYKFKKEKVKFKTRFGTFGSYTNYTLIKNK